MTLGITLSNFGRLLLMAVSEKWKQEELDLLTRARRNGELVKGMVRSVGVRKMPIEVNGRTETKETEVAILNLQGGVKAYCPAEEFHEKKFKSLRPFVGTEQDVIIDRLDLETQMAIVSVRKADEIKAENFWDELQVMAQNGQKIEDQVFEGVVTGFNRETNYIFVRMNGVDAFMHRFDWDHGFVPELNELEDKGTRIEVKIKRFDADEKKIQVSRKATLKDPFDFLKESMKDQAIVGRVEEVHPLHGIFVQVEDNLVVKAMKPRQLAEPIVGDIVQCRVHSIDEKKRRGKVVIIDYPQGKKQRKDLAGFLYQ